MSSDLKFTFIYLLIYCVLWGPTYALCIRGGQEKTYRCWFTPSLVWVLRIKLKPPGLASRTFTGWAILPFLSSDFFFSVDQGYSGYNVNTQTKGTVNHVLPWFQTGVYGWRLRWSSPCQGCGSSSLWVCISVFHSICTSGTSACWETSGCQHHLGTNRNKFLLLSETVVVAMKWIIMVLFRKNNNKQGPGQRSEAMWLVQTWGSVEPSRGCRSIN